MRPAKASQVSASGNHVRVMTGGSVRSTLSPRCTIFGLVQLAICCGLLLGIGMSLVSTDVDKASTKLSFEFRVFFQGYIDGLADQSMDMISIALVDDTVYESTRDKVVSDSDEFFRHWEKKYDEMEEKFIVMKGTHPGLADAHSHLRNFGSNLRQDFESWRSKSATYCAESDKHAFASSAYNTYTCCIRDARRVQGSAGKDYLKSLSLASRNCAERANFVTYAASILGIFCVVIVSVALLITVRKNALELDRKEQLVRQQSHELRNKYAPAIYLLQSFLDIVINSSETNTTTMTEQLRQLYDDACIALNCLREAENMHNTRLDMYKVMQGNYRLCPQVFELRTFMDACLKHEEAVAKAYSTRTPGDRSRVSFRGKFPESLEKREIHVNTDSYVLDHVVRNFLSNSRKYCRSGLIQLEFCGPAGKLLTFKVFDTGSGVPEDLRTKLFDTEVATIDNRGTGLGLPSIALFCRSAGGYAKLLKTQTISDSGCPVDEGGNGFSEFEFGILGEVVYTGRIYEPSDDSSKSPSPKDKTVETEQEDDSEDQRELVRDAMCNVLFAVVEDSSINRRCIVRMVKKAQNAIGGRDWTFVEFETVESARPFLAENASNPKIIVTLDESESHLISIHHYLSGTGMQSRGGQLTGTDAIQWLVNDIQFQGTIISATGDNETSESHLSLGAKLAWNKPLPSVSRLARDLTFILLSEQKTCESGLSARTSNRCIDGYRVNPARPTELIPY